MAVGSQTIALEEPGWKESFSVVREYNPDGIVIANLSATASREDARAAVHMINADALQLHFNIPQELAMPEGDRNFKGIIEQVARIVETCPVPVIAKEVGFGFSRESVQRLYDVGVRIFDIGGQGGTNFIAIEDKRGGVFQGELNSWGIPTAVSLLEILASNLQVKIIASGGIRSAPDAAKSLALGADMVGIAGSLLRILLHQGADELDRWVNDFLYRLRAVFLMSGASDIKTISEKPVIVLGPTAEWLRARDIDPSQWARR
jgi:isopentenyl-diphosphate delta-isomerase